MSEAIITRRVVKGGGSDANLPKPPDVLINTNQNYYVYKSGNYYVGIVGGGGGFTTPIITNSSRTYNSGAGGGTAYINQGIFRFNYGDCIPITIGSNGFWSNTSATSGGTTSFGTYLSAAGGGGASGGSGGIGYFNGINSVTVTLPLMVAQSAIPNTTNTCCNHYIGINNSDRNNMMRYDDGNKIGYSGYYYGMPGGCYIHPVYNGPSQIGKYVFDYIYYTSTAPSTGACYIAYLD